MPMIRAAGLHGEVHDLDDLLAEDLAERAAEDGEVLGEDADLAAVDGAVAGDHAVAVGPVLLHAEGRRAVPRQLVELDERALVEQARCARGRSSCPWRAASRWPARSRRARPRRGGARGRPACRRWCGCRCQAPRRQGPPCPGPDRCSTASRTGSLLRSRGRSPPAGRLRGPLRQSSACAPRPAQPPTSRPSSSRYLRPRRRRRPLAGRGAGPLAVDERRAHPARPCRRGARAGGRHRAPDRRSRAPRAGLGHPSARGAHLLDAGRPGARAGCEVALAAVADRAGGGGGRAGRGGCRDVAQVAQRRARRRAQGRGDPGGARRAAGRCRGRGGCRPQRLLDQRRAPARHRDVARACRVRLLDRTTILVAVLGSFTARYDGWVSAAGQGLHTSYTRACSTLGRRVRVELPTGGTLSGEAVGVDDEGRLQVDDGSRVNVLGAGDVVHLRAT